MIVARRGNTARGMGMLTAWALAMLLTLGILFSGRIF
jgi:hypothetical protein